MSESVLNVLSVDEFAFKPKSGGKRKCTKTDLSSNPNQSGAEHVGTEVIMGEQHKYDLHWLKTGRNKTKMRTMLVITMDLLRIMCAIYDLPKLSGFVWVGVIWLMLVVIGPKADGRKGILIARCMLI